MASILSPYTSPLPDAPSKGTVLVQLDERLCNPTASPLPDISLPYCAEIREIVDRALGGAYQWHSSLSSGKGPPWWAGGPGNPGRGSGGPHSGSEGHPVFGNPGSGPGNGNPGGGGPSGPDLPAVVPLPDSLGLLVGTLAVLALIAIWRHCHALEEIR